MEFSGIDKEAPEYAKAQTLLNTMAAQENKNTDFMAALEAKTKLDRRKRFAAKLEQSLLDLRMDVDVTTIGTQYTVLRIKYVLANKVVVNGLHKSWIIEKAKAAGFKEVQLTDGYGRTATWQLN